MPRERLRAWATVLVMLVALFALGCRSRGTAPSPSASASAASVRPEPEPSGVLAEIFVAHPDQAWGRFQPLLASALGFKPVTLAATLTDLLGIPAAYSPGVAIEKPIVGVLVDGDSPRAVIGVRMTSGAELVAALSTGHDPTHLARMLEGGRVTQLEPRRRGPVGGLAMGVCGNTLLVGAHGADLAKFGPYVARQLPARLEQAAGPAMANAAGQVRPPEGALVFVVSGKTLRGTGVERLERQWKQVKRRLEHQAGDQRRRHGDRAPDFAEPAAVIAGVDEMSRQLIGLLGDAASLTVVVEPSGGVVEVRTLLASGGRDAVAQVAGSWPAGDSRTLLRLPRETVAAVAFASTESGRQATGRRIAAALTHLFGARLGVADRNLVAKALGDLNRGRGDDLSIGLVATADGAGVAVGAASRDARALDAGVRGVLQSLQLPAVAEPLDVFVGRPRVAIDSMRVDGLKQPATRASIVWVARQGTDAPSPARLLWTVENDRFHAAMGPAASQVLAAQVRAMADEASSLAADERLVSALGRVEREATMTLFLRPEVLGGPRPGDPAQPLVLSMGSAGENLSVRMELDHATLASALRSQLGLRP